MSPNMAADGVAPAPGMAATLSRNAAISVTRVIVSSLVALVLPAYLTHHLPVNEYAAWVLILQLAAYVTYLDFGVQTAVIKYVAEFEARGDNLTAGQYATAGLALMSLCAMLGCVLSAGLAWQVPRLFHSMPPRLYAEVRVAVLLVGCSFSAGLLCAVFSAIFLGLQRYLVPMSIAILNKVLFTAAVLAAVFLRGSLAVMGAAAAGVNVLTGILQVAAWRRWAGSIPVRAGLLQWAVFKRIAHYCSMLSIWVVGMLFVSGLDVVIVGHYDYAQTGFYSIAVMPTTFAIVLVTSMLGPMVPASSALSTQRTAAEMGDLLVRATRYCAILLLVLGLPLVVFGLPILRLWVGPLYASHAYRFLQILVVANVLRNLLAPFATMVAAVGKQAAATATAVSEAAVNLGASLYLAHRFGAIGVAYGTLLGSMVTVTLHFAVTMRFTQTALAIGRGRLLLRGLLRPLAVALPSVLTLPIWLHSSSLDRRPLVAVLWVVSTLALAWFGGLSGAEQKRLRYFAASRLLPACDKP